MLIRVRSIRAFFWGTFDVDCDPGLIGTSETLSLSELDLFSRSPGSSLPGLALALNRFGPAGPLGAALIRSTRLDTEGDWGAGGCESFCALSASRFDFQPRSSFVSRTLLSGRSLSSCSRSVLAGLSSLDSRSLRSMSLRPVLSERDRSNSRSFSGGSSRPEVTIGDVSPRTAGRAGAGAMARGPDGGLSLGVVGVDCPLIFARGRSE